MATTKTKTTVPVKKEEQKMTKVDQSWFKDNAKVGLETIQASDLPVPRLNLVQRTSTKTNLRDGTAAKPGTFYYSATKEATENFPCYLLTANTRELPRFDSRDEYETAWEVFGVRSKDMMPFILTCRGSAAGAVSNFVANVIASKLPMFAYKVILESRYIESKKGTFYNIAFKDKGVLDNDNDKLMILMDLAHKYKQRQEALKDLANNNDKEEPTEEERSESKEEVNPEEIPF